MCGIVGKIGLDVKDNILNSLAELEYRGYDSSGISIINGDAFDTYKAVGKLINLKEKISKYKAPNDSIGIGHIRWATHGRPNVVNAHPQKGKFSQIVHNGIIENYATLKKMLVKNGAKFISDTDSEVIVHLFEYYLKDNDEFNAFKKCINSLEGAYALLLITLKAPDKIFFAKTGSPLVVAQKDDEIFLSSSDITFINCVDEFSYLEDGEYGYATKGNITVFNGDETVTLKKQPLNQNRESLQKNGFDTFMQKEIDEQSVVSLDTLMGRVKESNIIFDELDDNFYKNISSIRIVACGTSYNAGLVGSYLFERNSKIKTETNIASEFAYKKPITDSSELFIAISQSGETADTISAMKLAKKRGLKTLVICNVDGSTLTRLADYTILTRAGIEKSVASTKAFSTQVLIIWMLSIFLQKKLTPSVDITNEIKEILKVPKALKVSKKRDYEIKDIASKYLDGHGFFFIGRDLFYPLALEGALKLKEISYLHAEGYPAGEMKHGPIALVDDKLFTIALLSKNIMYNKTKSNLEEISARDGKICLISNKNLNISNSFIKIKEHSHEMVDFFDILVNVQLFAMHVGLKLGNDIDMPKNLAKSVTVE